MKDSCESGRKIQVEIQTFRLSPKLARGSLGDRELGGPERRLGPLCVCFKVVVESRSMRAKKITKKIAKKRL